MAERNLATRGATKAGLRRRGATPRGAAPGGMGAGGGSRALVRAWLLGTTALLPASGAALAQGVPANARPTGGQVVAGSATHRPERGQTTITQTTHRAAIDWQQFNVGGQHSVQFVQPNAQAGR